MATCSRCGKDVSLFERDIFTGACRQCQNIGARPGTLGCGTLILLGFVVAIAAQSGIGKVERRLEKLERSVDSLKAMIGAQTAEIHQLRQAVEESRAPAAARSR